MLVKIDNYKDLFKVYGVEIDRGRGLVSLPLLGYTFKTDLNGAKGYDLAALILNTLNNDLSAPKRVLDLVRGLYLAAAVIKYFNPYCVYLKDGRPKCFSITTNKAYTYYFKGGLNYVK